MTQTIRSHFSLFLSRGYLYNKMQQPAESTKPYLYYEQIINGLVSVPKKIQEYLGEAILVRNEKQRIEMEKQKQEDEAKRLSLVEEEKPQEEENASSNNSLFKLPLFGWFSSNKKTEDEEKPVDREEPYREDDVDKPMMDRRKPFPEDVDKSMDREPFPKVIDKTMDREPFPKDIDKTMDRKPFPEDDMDKPMMMMDREPYREDVDKTMDRKPFPEDKEEPEYVDKSVDEKSVEQEEPEDVDKEPSLADKEPSASISKQTTSEKCDIRKWTSKLE